ncbi:hypothetical protein KU306_14335 [Haloferax larsenii]|uniref:Uncharacterized protein n=1 Tax=Haloferax larsenii TaxID=302484 RepID=A0ABY5RCK0_HALLR|nr:DUF5820 family protein [Haloferax larsenii]ELZ78655.1 hypothetical protein C455_13248 [Haloferax larsenii JCM 13917]UVE50067.1 hypothetical protein KU306_14335 [Haloferax larsenii]
MTDLPDGWTLWNDEHEGRRILAYRPDVFDGEEFPSECLPTIFVSNGSRANRPGASQISTETWHAVLFLEPQIEAVAEEFDSREAALDGAEDIARRFADGEVDYRDAYQLPREEYFEKLDELTGRES